jgi:glycosyltransferase involved in cell wall biosynthesis
MKILFNASTNIKGGAIQTASNFIREAVKDTSVNWIFLVSPIIKEELKKLGIESANLIEIKHSPAKNINARKIIKKLENELKPDLVYTMSGPAYIDFKSTHIMGCSNAHFTSASFKDFNILKFTKFIYRIFQYRKANVWLFQTNTSRNGFLKRTKVSANKTHVISNAISELYKRNTFIDCLNKNIKILVPSADYKHKNLEIIPHIAYELKNKIKYKNIDIKFAFILTLENSSETFKKIANNAIKLGVRNNIINYGPYSIVSGPSLFENSHIMFLPTLLETFSAAYLEAMAMKLPIVTTNKDFAVEICQNAAIFFDPNDYSKAADCLFELMINPQLYKKLIARGDEILLKYPNSKQRYDLLVSIIKNYYQAILP